MLQLNIDIDGKPGDPICYDPYKLTMGLTDGTELITKRPQFQTGVVGVRVILGKKCNFDCKYCIQSNSLHVDSAPIDYTQLDSMLVSLVKFCTDNKISWISFWGGEPLLYFDTIKYIVEYMHSHIVNLGFYTITNGSLLTDEITDFLIKYDVTTILSHDGPYSAISRGHDVLDNPYVLRSVKRLYSSLSSFSINYVVTKYTNDPKSMVAFFTDRIGEHIKFGVCEPPMLLHDTTPGYLMTDSELSDYFTRLYDLVYTEELLSHFPQYSSAITNFLSALCFEPQVPKDRCKLKLGTVVAIDLEGNVLDCHNNESNDASIIGRLSHYDKVQMWPTFLDPDHELDCRHCTVLYFCRGRCPNILPEHRSVSCKMHYVHYLVLFLKSMHKFTNGGIVTGITGECIHAEKLNAFLKTKNIDTIKQLT